MKKYIKSAAAILLVLVMTFSIVGCKTKREVTQEEIDKYVDLGLDQKGEITFTYSAASTSEDAKVAIDNFINTFERKYRNVKVERDYSQVSASRISTGDIGDVFWFAETETYQYAIKDKALLQLDSFLEAFKINTSDVYGGIYSLGLVNGHLYFVARDYNQIGLIYNKDALSENSLLASVHKDWTWQEFLNICGALRGSENYYGANINLSYSPVYTAFLEAYTGRSKWCSTADKKIQFIDEEGEILKAIGEALTASAAGDMAITGINDTGELYKGKEAVFTTLVYPGVQGTGKSYDNKGIDWDMINMPLFPVPSFGCGASGVGVYSRTENAGAAALLALFFYTPEGQRAFNSGKGGSVPLLKSLDDEGFNLWRYPGEDDPWSEKNWDAWVYLADTASTPGQVNCRMPIEVASAINSDIGNILRNHLSNKTSYVDGFNTLEKKCNQIWEKLVV